MATRIQSLTVPVADKTKQDCHCGCAPCEGTCCRLDCIVQPRFFCGQLLTDADLSALLKWARDRFGLSRYRHGWGIVCGLDVRGKYAAPATIVVTPGYAVDCCGNDIIICEEASLDLKRVCRDQEDPCADLRRQLDPPGQTPKFADRLRAVDIYLQYDELSADPATAMGRGSCKQVSECEYSRTKETYKLTWELGVAGTDPLRARATRWHEEYEKCLDVLRNFRAQFGPNTDPRAKAQWLLRWLDEHAEYGLTFMRDQLSQRLSRLLRGEREDFFDKEQNLVAILFAFVQFCRNAYLNCACFGCDEDARLPLARVWLLPEDRATGQQCQIVTIDAYPPYRRPIQPECWPAPLGTVNVGRFIWHRWDEVCTAVADLGLNVDRAPFRFPATLADLEAALRCDLFVPCGERRTAVVLDVDAILELGAEIFGERVVGFCQMAGPGPDPGPGPGPEPEPEVRCPNIEVRHPDRALAGASVRFAVSLVPPFRSAGYEWAVSAGKITSGQGTSAIEVLTETGFTGPLTATVLVHGLHQSCNNKAAGTVQIVRRGDEPIGPIGGRPAPVEDDLTQIDQIGPGRAKALREAGIRTFADLANTPIEQLKEMFPPPVKEDLLREWIQKAKEGAG